MDKVVVSIERLVDEHQPGFVECALIDALGNEHLFVEKVPVVTQESLCSNSAYPRLGLVACEVEAQWQETDGRWLVRINTQRPWSIESTEGESTFVVLASKVRRG